MGLSTRFPSSNKDTATGSFLFQYIPAIPPCCTRARLPDDRCDYFGGHPISKRPLFVSKGRSTRHSPLLFDIWLLEGAPPPIRVRQGHTTTLHPSRYPRRARTDTRTRRLCNLFSTRRDGFTALKRWETQCPGCRASCGRRRRLGF